MKKIFLLSLLLLVLSNSCGNIHADGWWSQAKQTTQKYARPALKIVAGAGVIMGYTYLRNGLKGLASEDFLSEAIKYAMNAKRNELLSGNIVLNNNISDGIVLRQLGAHDPYVLVKHATAISIMQRLNDVFGYGLGGYVMLNGLRDLVKTYKS